MRRRAGFTLLELLVVMGLISLLIAMLMPSLSWARKSARRTACASNLHQIAIGLTNYLGDSDGILPYFIPLTKQNGEEDQTDMLKALRRYIDGDPVWTCPDDDTGVAEELGTSYDYWPGWIMWARELFRGDQPRSVARVVTKFYEFSPEKYPVMADAEGWHRPLDETGKNASWWDGSVSSLRDWTNPRWRR
jgi:prepilin-type N-terminal cleavage/methylation domain-containing protein